MNMQVRYDLEALMKEKGEELGKIKQYSYRPSSLSEHQSTF